MNKTDRLSYFFLGGILLIVAWSGLTTPFVTVLFSYLALQLLQRYLRKPWAAVLVFSILVIGIFVGFVYFSRQALTTLPHVASASIPMFLEYVKAHELEFLIPFDDIDGLKGSIIDAMKGELLMFAKYANIMTREFVSLIIGLVIGAGIFLNPQLDLDKDRRKMKDNLYSDACASLSERFTTFYRSFATVIGAQLVISSINTFFTGLYVFFADIPHAMVIVVVTFLCGLLPIIGNLISNSIIFFVSLLISAKAAVSALVFLIALHKFEYFLNSKIIGSRIRNPMWLTLLGLVVGEKLAGIPGMILAPVVLNYVKVETENLPAAGK